MSPIQRKSIFSREIGMMLIHLPDFLPLEMLYVDFLFKDFFGTIKRYRFNLQPYVWLDAAYDKEGWVWSRNNQKVWKLRIFLLTFLTIF